MPEPNARGRSGFLRRLETPGLSRRQEKFLNLVLAVVMLALAGGWGAAIVQAATAERPLPTRALTANPMGPPAPPPASFLLDRLVRAVTEAPGLRGRSEAVRVLIAEPGDALSLMDTLGLDTLPEGAQLEIRRADSPAIGAAATALNRPGAWHVLVRAGDESRRLTDLTVLSPVSLDSIEDGRIGGYVIGEWPSRIGRGPQFQSPAYDPPAGLIRVTPANVDLPVSEHLVLGDFLTKGQADVWPKYVALSPRLLDKVELTLQELENDGHPVENVGIISGFRTPTYNETGGSTAGRGSLSRHMYGDALDFYIDNDGDGQMDDLDGDGRVGVGDARVIADAAARAERQYPEYLGGIGVYAPNPGAHSGFVHVDARGYRARW